MILWWSNLILFKLKKKVGKGKIPRAAACELVHNAVQFSKIKRVLLPVWTKKLTCMNMPVYWSDHVRINVKYWQGLVYVEEESSRVTVVQRDYFFHKIRVWFILQLFQLNKLLIQITLINNYIHQIKLTNIVAHNAKFAP